MSGTKVSELSSWQKLLVVLAGICVLATVFSVLLHEPNPALPPGFAKHQMTESSESSEKGEAAKKSGSSDSGLSEEVGAVKDAIGFLVTVSIALAALAGYAAQDNLSQWDWPRVLTVFLLSIFGFFLTRALVFGYDAYGAIAVQLSFGRLFLDNVNTSIQAMGRSVVWCAASACALLAVRVMK